jgi:succinate-semialdehyde dehydrogenase/glutarate-semialdehyde dehydrogenase
MEPAGHSAAPKLDWPPTQLFIDGAWREAISGRRLVVDDPAHGSVVAEVADGADSDTRLAVDAAARAWPAWRATTALERADLLWCWHALIAARAEDLARLLTREQGKPLAEARAEISYANAFVRWFAEEARRAYGELIPAPRADRRVIVQREPVGVVAAITPWNFPAAMVTRKIAPALAAGCTVVLKPSELTPLSALALVELAREAGFPPGVINLVTTTDAPTVGAVLTSDARVRKLSFTGSTAVGKRLMAACADSVKKLSLELGGNAPFLVFDDADLERVVDGLVANKFRNAGQACIAANRVLVQDGIHDRFVARLAERVAALRVGRGDEDGVAIGPLISERARAKVEGLVEDAVASGAAVVVGGRALPELGPRWYAPTVLTGVAPGMRLACDEAFGPVVPVIRFAGESEAVAIANDTPYGLAAYFYTADMARLFRLASAIEAGIIGANEAVVSNETAPFGGYKESGIGREGSRHGLDEYTELKYLCIGGLGA